MMKTLFPPSEGGKKKLETVHTLLEDSKTFCILVVWSCKEKAMTEHINYASFLASIKHGSNQYQSCTANYQQISLSPQLKGENVPKQNYHRGKCLDKEKNCQHQRASPV